MKCYAPPSDIPLPASNFSDPAYDWQAEDQKYIAALKQKLQDGGYNGPNTGEIVRFGIADGYAQYMVAEKGRSMVLIHLPLGDEWDIPAAHMRGLTRKDILEDIRRSKAMDKLFGRSR